MDPLMDLAGQHGLCVINDAAQAHMAVYKGRPIAGIAHVTSYSTENSKHITTGDGGIVVTNDERLATSMRKLGSLGYTALKSSDGRIRSNKLIFQDPEYKRHDEYGCNYRMPEVAAALGLAQVERIDHFVDLRREIAGMYAEAIAGCPYLVPQRIPEGHDSSYWCFTVQYQGEDATWYEFRDRYLELGGDGIYAAWVLTYEETLFASGGYRRRAPYYYDGCRFERGLCPVAEQIQPTLMQFVNNYGSRDEAAPKVEALRRTIAHFGA